MNRPTFTGRRRAATLAIAACVLAAGFAAPSSGLAGPLGRPSASAQTAPDTTGGAPTEGSDGSLKSQYDEVLGREASVLRALAEAKLAKQQATDRLEQLVSQTKAKQLELVEAQQALTAAQQREVLRVEARRQTERRVARAVARLRRQAVASFVQGGEKGGVAEALLHVSNGEQVGQAVAFGKAALGDSDRLIRELQRARVAQRKAERAAKAAKSLIATHRQDVEGAARFLSTASDRQQELLGTVTEAEVGVQQALIEVQGRKALIESRINAISQSSDGIAAVLASIQAGQPDFVPGSVEISSPLPGVRVSSGFGMRFHPILHIARLHAGCDLGAPSGTPIHAAADGVVVLAGDRGGYGMNVTIDHGNSLGTTYNHQSKLLVKAGDVVKRGDIIGLVGTTGLSTGPHLHFETRLKGQPINPEGLIDFNAPVDYGETTTTTGG